MSRGPGITLGLPEARTGLWEGPGGVCCALGCWAGVHVVWRAGVMTHLPWEAAGSPRFLQPPLSPTGLGPPD